MRAQLFAFLLGLTVASSNAVFAGEADVLAVKAEQLQGGLWRFSVTVSHADEGWKHYANRFEIVSMDGKVLGTRELLHPHEHEQPFTRSLGAVMLPSGTRQVIIRAGDSVHGLGGKEHVFDLPR